MSSPHRASSSTARPMILMAAAPENGNGGKGGEGGKMAKVTSGKWRPGPTVAHLVGHFKSHWSCAWTISPWSGPLPPSTRIEGEPRCPSHWCERCDPEANASKWIPLTISTAILFKRGGGKMENGEAAKLGGAAVAGNKWRCTGLCRARTVRARAPQSRGAIDGMALACVEPAPCELEHREADGPGGDGNAEATMAAMVDAKAARVEKAVRRQREGGKAEKAAREKTARVEASKRISRPAS